jgi:hypothetical protein
MPGLPAVLGPCIEEAVARSPQWMTRAIDHACTQLQEESRRGSGDRQELALAAAELAQQRIVWCGAIAGALRKAITTGESPRQPQMRVSPSSLTLTLVDDSEVLKNIEASRLAMELESRVEKPLAELDKYMSAALSLESIQPEENPLRPGVFALALRSVMTESETTPGRPALWMRYMAEPLGAELASLYETCTKLLARANVRPADYRISSPAPLGAGGVRSSKPADLGQDSRANSGVVPLRGQDSKPRSAMSGWVELATQAIGGPALREFLFGGSQQQAQQPLAPSYYKQIDEELAALEARWDEAPPDPQVAREYQHLPVVDRPARNVGVDSPLNREVWGSFGAPRQRSLVRTRLRKQAKQVGQVMGLDLVRQLVDQVAQDPRLLAPVREAMVALEPSLARLAMHSPRFFGEHDSPARKLLEAVAQRSFKYNDEFSTEFRDFFDDVTRCFTALNGDEAIVDARPFETALGELARGWSEQDHAEGRDREEVMKAVQFAEARQAEADRIAWELSQRSDMEGAPAVVQDFLYGPWSLVIAHARLSNGGNDMDPGGYIRLIADLLWSVKRETTLRDPARAFEVIPRMLPKLRAGLDLLGQAPAETEHFFHALERLHRPVLKLRAKHRQASLHAELAAAPLDADLQPAPAHKPQARDETWMRDGELRACGFEDTLPSDYAALEPTPEPPAAAASPSSRPAPAVIPVKTVAGVPLAPVQADAIISTLREGQWVDLYSKQRWRRAQLKWASGRRTLFMFVSHGGRPHSMTQRSLQRLVINRLLRPVDSHEVVQHALDTVMRPRTEPLAA